MSKDRATLRTELADEFNRQTRRDDGQVVVASLAGGLGLLRESFYCRLHHDVERFIGEDSMLMPVSESRARKATIAEIALYQIVESNVAAADLDNLGPASDWYVPWLAQLVIGKPEMGEKPTERIRRYQDMTSHERRLAFTNVLLRVLPESSRAPLVLYDLFPLAIQIVTAVALGDPVGASKLRREQVRRHPPIGDCHQCHGQVLENGEQCEQCGNPLWDHEWLVAD